MNNKKLTIADLEQYFRINPELLKENGMYSMGENPFKQFEQKEVEMAHAKVLEEMRQPFGGILKLDNLFRIKGKPGLWWMRGEISKGGMANMVNYATPQLSVFAHANSFENVANFHFEYLDEEQNKQYLDTAKVFLNLEDEGLTGFEDLSHIHVCDEIMQTMVPGYNPDAFKKHHAKKVLDWYKIITVDLKQYEDTAKEEETVETKG